MLPAFGDSAGESLTFSLSQLINIPAKISENHQINLSFMSGGGERDMKKYISLIQPVYTSHVLPGVSFTRHLFFTLSSPPEPQPSRNTFLLETSFCATSFGVLQALCVLHGPGRVMSHNLWREIVCFVTGLTAGVTQVTYTDAGHVFCHASQMHTWYANQFNQLC